MSSAGTQQSPKRKSEDKAQRDLWVGVDLGGTKMLATVCDSDFEILGRKRKSTKGHEGCETGIERVCSLIRRAMEDADVTEDRIAGIGFGAPGPLNLDDGVVLETPNLGWRDVPVRKLLEAEFNCPVTLVNDVDAGVYGEFRFGAAVGARRIIGLFPGTGIGGGCVIDGEILRGNRNSCFEVGHIQIDPAGPLCGCGQHGCLEAVASRLAISAEVAKAAYRGQAPHLMNEVGVNLANIRSGAISAAIQAGDSIVEDIVRTAADQLGTVAAGLVNLLNPDVVLLGGGLVEALPELYAGVVSQTVDQKVMPSYLGTYRVEVAGLGDFAAVKGAAAWAAKCMAQVPASAPEKPAPAKSGV